MLEIRRPSGDESVQRAWDEHRRVFAEPEMRAAIERAAQQWADAMDAKMIDEIIAALKDEGIIK